MEFLLLVFALAAMLWGGWLMHRGGSIVGILLVLLVGSCAGATLWSQPFWPFPLTADRILLALVCGQFLLIRRRQRSPAVRWSTADRLLAGLLVVLLLSAIVQPASEKGVSPLPRLFAFYFLPLAVYAMARRTSLQQTHLHWILATLTLFGVYLGATAVCEARGLTELVFPRYISSSEFEEFLGRGRGPFLNPIANGITLAMCVAATLMFWPRSAAAGRLLVLAAVAVQLAGAYYSLTRSVWIGIGLTILVVLLCCLPKLWRTLMIGAVCVTSVGVVVTQWDNLMVYKRDKDLDASLSAESAALRPILATVAWKMFLDRPLLGCGYARYFEAKNDYLADRTTDYALDKVRPYVQHNVFLAALVENGLIGLALYLLLIGCWTRDAWRLWKSPAPLWSRQAGLVFLASLAAWVANGMFHDVSIMVMMNMFQFFLAGLVQSLLPQAVAVQARSVSAPQPGWTLPNPAAAV